jgi:PAS domain S-box-containing protein
MREITAEPEQEIKRLQRCISDLVGVLALPAAWNNGEPRRILETFLDALVKLLDLNFLYAEARVASHEAPIEMLRTADSDGVSDKGGEIHRDLHQLLDEAAPDDSSALRRHMGGREISILPLQLGIEGGLGLIVAGCERLDFPQQTERLVMSVAANQLAVMLQQAQLLNEQRRVALELNEHVAQRTAELGAANLELRREIAERKEIEEQLRQSEAFLLDAQQLSRTGSWKHDLVSNIVSGTPEIERIFAITPQDDRSSTDFFFNRIHPEDREGERMTYVRALTDKCDFESDYRIVLPDGSIKYIHNTGRAQLSEAGEVVGFLGTAIDLTEQHRIRADLEKALTEIKKSEAKLWQVIDTIPTLVWCNLPDGPNEFLNKGWHDYTGLSPDESHGWGWQVAFHPEDLPPLMKRWQELLFSGEPGEIEARLQRFDGVYRWFLVRVEPFRDETGAIVRWYGTSTDIHDRKLAEQALRESERTSLETVNNIPGLVARTNAIGELEFLNRQALEYFGKSIEEMQNWILDGTIHPDDAPVLVEARKRSVEEGGTYEYEARFRRADSLYRWFQVRGGLQAHDMTGSPTSRYVLLVDIEARKQAEEKLRQSETFVAEAQHLARIGSFSWLVATGEIKWSEQLYRIFEFELDVSITFDLIGSRVHPEDMHLIHDMIESAHRSISDYEYEYRLLMSDRSIKYLHLTAHASRDREGRLEYIGAIQDVTQRFLSEEALSKARSELAKAARTTSVGVLTASIAHEVNQPLSGIITNASTCLRMLSADPPNLDGARETARRTIRDGNRASDVIARLRTLFSKKEVTAEPIDINETAREVIALLLSELQTNRVVLRQEFAEGLPLFKGDRVQLQQVILNLLRNASDAMSSVENWPKQLLLKTELDGEHVRLSVQDSGVGFDPEVADRLFESFFTTKEEGMGIGLSVSRSIIEAHGGRMWATANDGPGATFAFSIPCEHIQ